MQVVTSSLIAAVLLAHALLGCCWQYVHALGAPHASMAAACDCCEHENPANPPSSPPGEPCDCGWECHGICVYVPEKSSLASPLASIDAGFVALVAPPVTALDLDAASRRWSGNHPPCGPPTGRLYLDLQILLI